MYSLHQIQPEKQGNWGRNGHPRFNPQERENPLFSGKTRRSRSSMTGCSRNKRSSAPASGPTNDFFNAHQLYSSHLIILFPDSKRPGVPVPLRLAWSPDGTYLASCGDEGSVLLWEASDGTLLQRFQVMGRSMNGTRTSEDTR